MSSRTVHTATKFFSCCLLSKPGDASVDPGTLKNQHNSESFKGGEDPADAAATTSAAATAASAASAASAPPVAFFTGDFDYFPWEGNRRSESTEEEETRVLNDLLRLGLELGDLESVFGNTQLDVTSSSGCRSSGVNDQDVTQGATGSEGRVVRCGENSLDGDGAEESFLLDGDLQDALLDLPGLEVDPINDQRTQDKGKAGYGLGIGTSSDTSIAIDCGIADETSADCLIAPFIAGMSPATTASLLVSSIANLDDGMQQRQQQQQQQQQKLQEPLPLPAAATDAPVTAETPAVTAALPSTSCCRQEMHGVFCGEDVLGDFDAAAVTATADPFAATASIAGAEVDEGVAIASPDGEFGARHNGVEKHRDHGSQRDATVTTGVIAAAPSVDAEAGTPAAASAATTTIATTSSSSGGGGGGGVAAGAAGVPTRLLDAIDLWESANAYAKKKKKAAKLAARERAATAAAAAAAGEGGGEDGLLPETAAAAQSMGKPRRTGKVAPHGSSSSSSSSSSHKKKKNEFGKRRRSSGGGNPPVLDDGIITSAAAAAVAASPSPTPASCKASKAKGNRSGKGKKVDPLVTLKDARSMSKKPLIVQWLKSDGCESDTEAEAALGRAVGSLSAISRYWGGGG